MLHWEFNYLSRFYDDAGYDSQVAEPVRQALESVLDFKLMYVRMKTCVGSTLS